MIEKRNFSRVDYRKEAEVYVNGAKYQAEIENLSLKGAFLKIAHQLQIDDQLELVINLVSDANDFKIELKGKVVRLTPEGVGVVFERMDLDSFTHLRNIIAYNFGDDDAVMEEFYNYHRNTN